jgi:hypothetical protein
MKRKNILFGVLVLLFALIAVTGVATLTMSAAEGGGGPSTDPYTGGSWEFVCCGSACDGGVDYCVGSGSYTCCK